MMQLINILSRSRVYRDSVASWIFRVLIDLDLDLDLDCNLDFDLDSYLDHDFDPCLDYDLDHDRAL